MLKTQPLAGTFRNISKSLFRTEICYCAKTMGPRKLERSSDTYIKRNIINKENSEEVNNTECDKIKQSTSCSPVDLK